MSSSFTLPEKSEYNKYINFFHYYFCPLCRLSVLNLQRPEKKKRKKLMKDSIHLANMLRRFTREKEEMRKKNLVEGGLLRPATRIPNANVLQFARPKAASSSNSTIIDLTADPAIMSLLGSSNNDLLQDMMGNLDFGMLDSPQPPSPVHGENDSFGMGSKAGSSRVTQGTIVMPPPLPSGLPGPLMKRIEDLRAVCTHIYTLICM